MSDIQCRILVYVATLPHRDDSTGGIVWWTGDGCPVWAAIGKPNGNYHPDDRSVLSRSLARLERRGLIRRVHRRAIRRTRAVALTAAGAEKVARIMGEAE